MAKRVRRASPAQISWFKQNDKRAHDVLQQAINARTAQGRFTGLQSHEIDAVAAYLDSLRNADVKMVQRAMRMGVKAPQFASEGLPPLRIPTNAITTSFKAEILDGTHASGDTYKMALYVSASTIGPATTVYTATNEVANGNGYTTGGITLAGRQVVTDGTTVILDWTTDPQWAAATITARGCMIYNSSKANRSIAVFDFGADISSTNGNFTVTLPAPTAAAGAIRIA